MLPSRAFDMIVKSSRTPSFEALTGMTRTSVRLSIVTEWGSCMSALRTARWSRRSEPIMFKYFLENRMNLFLEQFRKTWRFGALTNSHCRRAARSNITLRFQAARVNWKKRELKGLLMFV